jgi:hypothetical protein
MPDLKKKQNEELSRNKKEKEKELRSSQEKDISNEKENAKKRIEDSFTEKKEELKKSWTIRRYYIYFRLRSDDTLDSVSERISRVKPTLFRSDLIGKKRIIERQKISLYNFFCGNVKNPFISAYLFNPGELDNAGTEVSDLDFFTKRLNDQQKEAVKKAVASKSIFLLQGPPGTGKTEVIAEIAAQLAIRGKRVLMSSETHKAIDNMFERLPKIPEIRTLRLIKTQSKKDISQFSPERLVDNFYLNISDRLDKDAELFMAFNKTREKFGEEYKLLRIEHDKLNKEESQIRKIEIVIDGIRREIDSLEDRLNLEKDKMRSVQEEKDEIEIKSKRAQYLNLSTEDEDDNIFKKSLLDILGNYPMLKQDFDTLLFIHKMKIHDIK